MLAVRIYGDPVLRKTAEKVAAFDDTLLAFVEQMKETMYREDGVGLAAPQVGSSIRLAVIDPTGGEQEPFVFINPEITWHSGETGDSEEGCLSVPDINLKVNRPLSVSVTAQNERGETFSVDKATGLFARAIQHEIDHLDGILFVDRASPMARQMVSGKLKKMAKSQRDSVRNT